MDDISEIHGFCENVHQVLHVYCKYKEQSCAHALLLRDLDAHESSCDKKDNQIFVQLHEPDTSEVNIADKTATPELAAPEPVVPEPAVPRPVRRRGPSRNKMPLSKVVDTQDCRTRRLKPFYDSFNKLCDDQYENKRDILFFMLRHELRKNGDLQTAKEIENLWKPERKTSLSVEQCLSLRVDTLMTKGQYRQQYGFFEQNLDKNVLQPPSKLDNAEKTFLPGATEYQITDLNGNILLHHMPEDNPKPIDILSNFDKNNTEVPTPNIKGVRWNYASAIAESLKEIEPKFDKKIIKESQSKTDKTLHTVIKDGADGLGEVSVYKEKGDKFLPDKAFRFSFAVMSSRCVSQNSSDKKLLYRAKNPNSVRTNRSLLECIADENNKASVYTTLLPIEKEREFLKDKILKVNMGEGQWRSHRIKFYNSTIDEKHDRAISGYQGSGSSFIRVLCHATHNNCKHQLGTFKIERHLDETRKLANYVRLNPDNLNDAALSQTVQGVKSLPISLSDTDEKLIDATHADINIGSFFSKIVNSFNCRC